MATRLPRKQAIFLMFSVMFSHVTVILLTFVVENGSLRAGGSAIDTGGETTARMAWFRTRGCVGQRTVRSPCSGPDAPPPPPALRSVTVRWIEQSRRTCRLPDLRMSAHAELRPDARAVVIDGALRQAEPRGDLLRAVAARHESQYPDLVPVEIPEQAARAGVATRVFPVSGVPPLRKVVPSRRQHVHGPDHGVGGAGGHARPASRASAAPRQGGTDPGPKPRGRRAAWGAGPTHATCLSPPPLLHWSHVTVLFRPIPRSRASVAGPGSGPTRSRGPG